METEERHQQDRGRASQRMPDTGDGMQPTMAPLGRHQVTRKRLTRMPRSDDTLSPALGWLGVVLGIAKIIIPDQFTRAIGAPRQTLLVRGLGIRDVTVGAAILTQKNTGPWLWARVFGDALDLALLAGAAGSRRPKVERLAMAAVAVAALGVLDVQASRRRTTLEGEARAGPVHIDESLAVNRSPEECYRFFRDFANFPKFMTNLESVQKKDERHSHWIASESGGRSEWDCEILLDEPNEIIVWHTVSGAAVPHAGTVSFEKGTGGRGTLVRVEMEYRPPRGIPWASFSTLFGMEPAHQAREDLRRFKQLIETGEIATTSGQASGKRSALGRLFAKDGRR